MDSDSSELEESRHQSTRPKLAGLDPRALMAEGLSPEALAPEPTPAIEGYEMIRPLGSGGMGTVFLARQKSLDREVAIKVLHSGQEFATQFYDRLEREARAMATLSHPNIVAVHDFLRLPGGDAAIIMEAIDAGNLRDELRAAGGALPTDRAIELIRRIAEGLGAAHEVGIVHRDMKPENVLITRGGTAKVTDFGIALPLNEDATRLTVTGTTLGTVAYMAPEQLNGDPVDARADVYSLGVMFYEMLTGTRPQGNFDDPDAINPKIPKAISKAALRALRTEPAERYQNTEAFIDALSPIEKPGRRRWLGIAAAVLAGLLGAAGIYQATQSNEAKDNLLTAIDPADATIAGTWIKDDESIVSGAGINLMRVLSEVPHDGYDVEMEFTRLTGHYSVALFFRTEQGVGSLEFDAWEDNLSGIQLIDGNDLRELSYLEEAERPFEITIENDRRYLVRLEVRPERVRVFVDGVWKQEIELAGRELGVSSPWAWNPQETPDVGVAIGSYQNRTRFHQIRVREAGSDR